MLKEAHSDKVTFEQDWAMQNLGEGHSRQRGEQIPSAQGESRPGDQFCPGFQVLQAASPFANLQDYNLIL